MRKEFDWIKFEYRKIAVHCSTENEAKDFCKKAKEKGLQWFGCETFPEDYTGWEYYKDDTCYCNMTIITSDEHIESLGIDSESKLDCENKYYKIIEWYEYMDNYKSDVILPVDDILNRMTERQREIYKLYLQGYTQEEIGEKLGVTQRQRKEINKHSAY